MLDPHTSAVRYSQKIQLFSVGTRKALVKAPFCPINPGLTNMFRKEGRSSTEESITMVKQSFIKTNQLSTEKGKKDVCSLP